jgi:hypothetical protein
MIVPGVLHFHVPDQVSILAGSGKTYPRFGSTRRAGDDRVL